MVLEKVDIAPLLRVNLAGEYGAKRIYEGQLGILKDSPSGPLLKHMKIQEENHLCTFEELVVKNRVRPPLLHPLWHVAGYALGVGTALLGEKAAMACTVAVEEVIDTHYEKQLRRLKKQNPALRKVIKKFQKEEQEHRDLAREKGAEEAPAYILLAQGIKTASRLAIWLSERI
ncbi:MAG: demethoxyubiquinone hydroxylase family protein [Alphaproteobacteria bacterium]|nr:demethoxyubiquinone hydroxylase family protein [Alphaproteobacteria bacterium]